MSEDKWKAYLKRKQAEAHRAALREATLEDEEKRSTERRGSVDGKGTIQIVFTPPPQEIKPDVEES